MAEIINALSIDVEDYFQVSAFDSVIAREEWASFPSRVVQNTQRILELFAKYNTSATFFILGWVADHYPKLVRDIADAGHEIASHGYWHRLVYNQSPQEFCADIKLSLHAIQCALHNENRVIGYRAPSFSITNQSLWAFDVLQKNGLRYDSSVFPLFAHDRYGMRHSSRFAFNIGKQFWEFPMSTVRIFGKNLPSAGGGYFRMLPLVMLKKSIDLINNEGQPAVIYLHPWEVDPDQPKIKRAPMVSKLRHYVNLDQTYTKLDHLLSTYKFAPMSEVFAHQLHSPIKNAVSEG
jgi:polysaccharide deacetylase family protein (PEP-CTERM system associated)